MAKWKRVINYGLDKPKLEQVSPEIIVWNKKLTKAEKKLLKGNLNAT